MMSFTFMQKIGSRGLLEQWFIMCTSMIFVDKKMSSLMINPYYISDVDECSLINHDCDKHAICTNTIGSFTCKCDLSSHHLGDGKTCTPHRKPSFFYVFIHK